jgi:hypothetical protein
MLVGLGADRLHEGVAIVGELFRARHHESQADRGGYDGRSGAYWLAQLVPPLVVKTIEQWPAIHVSAKILDKQIDDALTLPLDNAGRVGR